MESFGNRLLNARKSKKMTQDELADKTGLSQAAISQFEKDQRVPVPATISKIAKCLGIEREQLAGQNETEFQTKILMRNLDGLRPESIKKINEIVEIYKKAESRSPINPKQDE